MLCENEFCIYWSGDGCTLLTVELDDHGCCRDCVYIQLTDHQKEKAREKTIRTYEKQYDKWD